MADVRNDRSLRERGRSNQSACHLNILKLPVTFSFTKLHSSIINHLRTIIVFDEGILVAAIVKSPILRFLTLHLDKVFIFALAALGCGVDF